MGANIRGHESRPLSIGPSRCLEWNTGVVTLAPSLLPRAAHDWLDPLRNVSGNCDRALVGETMGSSSFLGRRQRVRRVLRCWVFSHWPSLR